MKGIFFVAAGIAMTVACWGMYGPVLHKGQDALGSNRLKPLICVGVAYFIVAIIVPIIILAAQGELKGHWTSSGISWSMLAGAAGALGAMGIILALSSGGKPVYVMPIVFGGAPIINSVLSMYMSKAWKEGISPIFFAGLALVIVGAALVLVYAPKGHKGPTKPPISPNAMADDSPAANATASGL